MKKLSREFKIGFVVLFILVFFSWGYSFLGGLDFLGHRTKVFYTFFDNVSGLHVESPVLISGYKVGKVIDIKLQTNENKGKLRVTFSVQTDLEFSQKSKVFISSISLMAGKCLVIAPVYDKDIARSGIYLDSGIQKDFIAEVKSHIVPIKDKVASTVTHIDSVMVALLKILNENNTEHLRKTLYNLEKTTQTAHLMLSKNTENLSKTLQNIQRFSDTLANANLGLLIKQMGGMAKRLQQITKGIQKGEGSLGKFVTNDSLYVNLNKTLLEMGALFKELKEHPKRFVHFSIFGKKDKGSKK